MLLLHHSKRLKGGEQHRRWGWATQQHEGYTCTYAPQRHASSLV
jgi:hypothetical protein